MEYYEYTFHLEPAVSDAADVLSAFLAEAGFETFESSTDGELKAWVQQTLCDEDTVQAACLSLKEAMGVATTYEHIVAQQQDWNEQWERESFSPIDVDGQVYIHAPWQESGEAETDIVIEPRMAFGTGTHATTSLLISILLSLDLEGKSVIDAGCGTGILGMVCLKRGATQLLAYDIDEWSTANTMRNLELNGLSAQVLHGGAGVLDGHSGYDIVLANINRNILLAEVPRMVPAMAHGARLVVSGFYPADAPALQSAFSRLGLETLRQEEKDGWCAIVFGRNVLP